MVGRERCRHPKKQKEKKRDLVSSGQDGAVCGELRWRKSGSPHPMVSDPQHAVHNLRSRDHQPIVDSPQPISHMPHPPSVRKRTKKQAKADTSIPSHLATHHPHLRYRSLRSLNSLEPILHPERPKWRTHSHDYKQQGWRWKRRRESKERRKRKRRGNGEQDRPPNSSDKHGEDEG